MVLRTQWPWTVRARNGMLDYASQPNSHKIHGVFGPRDEDEIFADLAEEEDGIFADNSIEPSKKDYKKLKRALKAMNPDARKCMDIYWPSLVDRYTNMDLWIYEFLKHATQSGLNMQEYFYLALHYFNKLTKGLNLETNKRNIVKHFKTVLSTHARCNMKTSNIPSLHYIHTTSLRVRGRLREEARVVFEGLSCCIRLTELNGIQICENHRNKAMTSEHAWMMIVPLGSLSEHEP